MHGQTDRYRRYEEWRNRGRCQADAFDLAEKPLDEYEHDCRQLIESGFSRKEAAATLEKFC